MTSTTFKKRLLLQLLTKQRGPRAIGAQGFTLIELLVVIVILGVLGAVGYGAYISQLQQANENSAQVAAVGAAKNCAALLVTGDATSFEAGIGPEISINFSAAADCKLGTTFNATAGTDTQAGSGGATISTSGSVTPL